MSDPLSIPMDSAGKRWLVFAPDPARRGWASYHEAGTNPGSVFVRFSRRAGGGADLQEVHVARKGAGALARLVGSIPLGRVEAAANQPWCVDDVTALLPPVNAVMLPFPWELEGITWWLPPSTKPMRAPSLKLRARAGSAKKPDDFYRRVADAFAWLATTTDRPAALLAEANDVPTTTIHGWIKTARQRGLLVAPQGEA